MSSDEIAIRVQGLSKCYQIYDVPGDRLKQFIFPRLQRMFWKQPKQYFREFWALKEVSFEVKKGETVGIIGRNGSGKSTLLQMVCGTLTPNSGRVQTIGRIAALLELGSGFNPEFTGRENVFMYATVLGLSTEEIQDCFDDIVIFADIGDFIDQPVKTYSSGMFVRLAFSVSVHTQPDILIVDEALSVGDIAFQNKCIERINLLKQDGTSILFVSHDLSTMQIISDRVIWINDGSLVLEGEPTTVCQEYYSATTGNVNWSVPENSKQQIIQQPTGMARFSRLSMFDSKGKECCNFVIGDEIRIEFELIVEKDLEDSIFTISIYTKGGDWIIGQTSREEKVFWPSASTGQKLTGSLILTPTCLAPNDYLVAFAAFKSDISICYALTDLGLPFSVRAGYQIWGKFIHPCEWVPHETLSHYE